MCPAPHGLWRRVDSIFVVLQDPKLVVFVRSPDRGSEVKKGLCLKSLDRFIVMEKKFCFHLKLHVVLKNW